MFTGVGTATIMNFASRILVSSAVNSTVVFFIPSLPTSLVGSTPFLYNFIFSALRSYPMTFTFFAKATAIGIPT